MFRKSIALLLTLLLLMTAVSESPYTSYTQDAWGNSVPAPDSYLPRAAFNCLAETGKALKAPSDLFVWNDRIIYVSDSGNDRIVVLDADYSCLRVIDRYTDRDGVEYAVKNPAGIFVDGESRLYICLPDEEKVVVLNAEDKLTAEYLRPETDLLDDNTRFSPEKVLANRLGTVFVLPKGLYLGAVMYGREGNFLGFYGANDVAVTVQVLLDHAWKQILSQEQVSSMARYVPVQFSSFDIDGENFIYTCTNENNTYREISKLNTLGDNVLTSYTRNVVSQTYDYGDIEKGYYMGQVQDTRLVDICVNDRELIYALDKTRGRVFVYDQESHLLSIFGGPGYQMGTFHNPAAIDTFGDDVLVLDSETGLITVFERTGYGELMENAVLMYIDGRYAEARTLWEEVICRNINCTLAYTGIGKALYEEGSYREAMHYFELGYDREGYSRAYEEYRKMTARAILPYVFTVAAVAAVGTVIYVKVRRRRKGGAQDE